MSSRLSLLSFLGALACTDLTKPVDTAGPFESAIVGPYAPGLFRGVCSPEVADRLSAEITRLNEGMGSVLSATEDPIEITGNIRPINEAGEVFYDNGTQSISGFLQTNSFYMAAEGWDLACLAHYIYAPRSDTDSTLGLYGGEFVVYLDLGDTVSKWTIVWTSSLGQAVPAVVAWNLNGGEWESYSGETSGERSPLPDLHSALMVLEEAALAAEDTPVLCPSGVATAEECEILE